MTGPSSRCLLEHSWKISYGPADDRLLDFYIPALSRSVLYQRTAGFFSSTALAVAAAGVVHLVRAGGRMRLFVGAELSEDDVQAIERGEEEFGRVLEDRLLRALEELSADRESAVRRRLEVLAWMVAQGVLEVRVVLPTGPDGRPLPAGLARDYFHAKEGLFTDGCGHQLAFSGSVNETAQGWERNYEQFMVYTSWDSSRPYLLQVAERIKRLGEGREEGWIALAVPQAVRRRLLDLAPEHLPERDPLEVTPPRPQPIPGDQRERILFQFLRDAPYLRNGEAIGIRAGAFTPWPHQARIAAEVIRRFPERFLLADEVGLGKTIEAGLAIRSLVLCGKVRRCLILVPKSVLRQWQEELYEKFSLNVPAYDGQSFRDYYQNVLPAPSGNPWDAYPIVLASTQLAKRTDRRDELLAAGPFDLVVVDEAHHARRREFRTPRYRPNRLLQLLEGDGNQPGLAQRTRGLLLLTATPMQLYPVEVYDLLRQLEIPAVWAVSEDRFLRFLEELRAAAQDDRANWSFLLRLARQGIEDRALEELLPGVRERLGELDWALLEDLVVGRRGAAEVARLSPQGRAALLELCRRASPLGLRMFRSTRDLLRRYRSEGLLTENIPTRQPQPVWIDMSEAEWVIYGEVERYVSEVYQRLEGERKGLGFIMTVYRRRLTSSFAALARSLERRRAFLAKHAGSLFGLTDEDIEDADLHEDAAEELEAYLREAPRSAELQKLFDEEVGAIETLLSRIAGLPEDTKFQRLLTDLGNLLSRRETVAVFTHYTDTMDYLRERLAGVYGSRLACYSGRGGERYREGGWVSVSKEEVKNAFREGEIQVLICTEAASEGLNLQTCGVLVNYDVPWNPMRVEQRIGRFDRIGQVHPDVWINHYFLRGPRGEETVEAQVYRALGDRIGWFRITVGEVQPILVGVERTIQRAAMTTGRDRNRILQEELAAIREDIERAATRPIDLTSFGAVPENGDAIPPVSLSDLERVLLTSSLRERFVAHPELAGAYRLDLEGRLWEVTFDPAVADAHPGRVRLLTFGEQLLWRLLALVDLPSRGERGAGLIRASAPGFTRWYAPTDSGLSELTCLADVQRVLTERECLPVEQSQVQEARKKAAAELGARLAAEARAEENRQRRHLALLEERARVLLAEGAACEWVISDAFDFHSACGILVARGYPWAGLARLVGFPERADVEAFHVRFSEGEEAAARLKALRSEAGAVLSELAGAARDKGAAGLVSPELTVEILPLGT
ncbi:MAG: hypothetical protein KatS3mg081_0129 [Gemmatimonadales bacterium]|nr:MAG: hypothetical protein KatS3mg081_0129 [Gemmatimonadales bacterium]